MTKKHQKFVYLTRPDGSRIAVDPFYVSMVRPPLQVELPCSCVLEPQRQQVNETFEQVVAILESITPQRE